MFDFICGLLPQLAHDVIDMPDPVESIRPVLLVICALVIAGVAAYVIYKRNHGK